MRTRLFWTSALLIAVCLAWLVPFSCILLYGTHVVREPSRLMLFCELCLFVGLVVFGVLNIVKVARHSNVL